MTRRAGATRLVKHRTLGSNTALTDEWSVPRAPYHFGRFVRWCWRHPRILATVVLTWAVTARLGAGVGIAVMVLAAVGGLTGWLAWRRRSGEAGAYLSLRDTVAESRQRWTLERQWELACRASQLTGPRNSQVPKLRKVKAKGDGSFTATVVAGPIGVPVPLLQKQTVSLAEVIGCREVVVTQVAPGIAHMEFHWRDPVGRVLPLIKLPAAPRGQLSYGIRQDGSVASIRSNMSVLIGGLTRKGKSNAVWALLADAIRTNTPLRLYVSDPKGGVELDALEAMIGLTGSLIEVRGYAKTPAETVKMIELLEGAMHKRQEWMKANKVRQVEASWENPRVVLVLDETLPLTDLLKKGTDSALGRIAYTGAAAGYVVWACTQVAQVDSIGRFRDLVPQRICFATPNPQVTDSVLGQGSESAGALCSRITMAGVGFSSSDGDQHPRKFRAAFVSDDESRMIAAGKIPQAMIDHELEVKGQTALYRYWSAADPEGSPPRYIGITGSMTRREAQHDADLREFMDGDVRRTVEWFPNRKSAMAAEKAAIEREKPLHNVVHNGANPNRRRDKMKAAIATAGGRD